MVSLEKILGTVLEDEKALSTLREAVTDDLVVANPHYHSIMNWTVDFYDQYETLPSEQDAHVWFLTQPEERQKQLKSAWRELDNQDLGGYTLSFLAETALEELRKIAAKNATRRMTSMGEQLDPETLSIFTERIEGIRPVELSGIADLSDVSTWAKPQKDHSEYRTTGIPKLDRYIRGFSNELVFVLAEANKGKSSLLVNFGRAAALEGATVLHISLEIDLHATAQRYYMRISEADKQEFIQKTDGVQKRLKKWFSLARGSIHSMYLPAYSINVNDLKRTVDIFAQKHDGIDMLVLDYLDLLDRTPQQSRLPRDEQERRLSHEVRTIATDHEASILSAAQANMSGYGKESLSMKHMGGGLAKNQAADIIMGLMQTEDEMTRNHGRIKLIKVRESGGKGAEIPLYFDLDRMVIMDLDDPDARRLRAEKRGQRHA